MAYQLSDIFIGNYGITQGYGVNEANYAKFGLKGHNGQDWGVPSNTQILAAADGWIAEVGSDPSGYGNYVKIIHNGYLTLYAHLDHATVKVNDRVVTGQLIGLSDNTGNSTGAHLHFGIAPCDVDGKKTEADNGYSGYIDPNSDRCVWTIKNPTQPVASSDNSQSQGTYIDAPTFKKLVANSTANDAVCDELRLAHDVGKDAETNAIKTLKLDNSTKQTTIENLNKQIPTLEGSISTLNNQVTELTTSLKASQSQANQYKSYEELYKRSEEKLKVAIQATEDAVKQLNQAMGQYKNTSVFLVPKSTLISVLISRTLNLPVNLKKGGGL